ncbi:MAG: nickel pincer cofactor biosynthesis protein LarC [Actinobacteria bacterium]|nr:MAG: nickel pincer cofactor biosynthesis protein LarC [Actinomycetota bacterium]
MKIAYFDCFSGISGDMVLGALLDIGLPLEHLREELAKLPLTNYEINAKPVQRSGLAATKVSIKAEEKGVVRTWSNVKTIIEQSELSEDIKNKALEIFLKLAEAESKIHKKDISKIHFHEVGATDSIVDIVGAVIGMNYLEVDDVISSEVATGMGMVRSDHGMLPIPAPATLEILKDVPVYSGSVNHELTTPTGAAILKSFATTYGPLPTMSVEKIGYGAGATELEIPNVLRLMVGALAEKQEAEETKAKNELTLVETNVDDSNPQFFGYIMDKLFAKGALDVWSSPIYMKKNRPAITLSVLCPKDIQEKVIQTIFEETTTLGVRLSEISRKTAARHIKTISTKLGDVAVKIAKYKDKVINIAPEYEDCAKIAKNNNLPIKKVYDIAKLEATRRHSEETGNEESSCLPNNL